jgi:two-component system, OmpR family, response regulator
MTKPIEASIVVVDDEPSIRELLVASLHFAGFEVNAAASGSQAIEVIEKVQPDLIVLDVMLPDIDGFTVTRRNQTGRHRRTGAFPDGKG